VHSSFSTQPPWAPLELIAENCSLPLSQHVQPGLRDPLVLMRLHAGYANGADALVLVHDRQRALDQDAGGKAGEGRPILHPILEEFARALVRAEVLAFPIATSAEIGPAPSTR
jgi:hypothetical protein